MPTQLTAKLLRGLEGQKPERRIEYRDASFGEGNGQLVLRHEPSGRLYWSFVYYVPGGEQGGRRPRRRVKLGRYPKLSLADARKKAGELEGAIDDGRDPAAARHGQRSFADLWAEYLERYAKPNKKSWRADKSMLERHVLGFRPDPKSPPFGDLAVTEVTRRDVVALLDAIMDKGLGRSANIVKSLLSGIFAFGADRGWLEQSPILGMRRPAKDHARGRVLSEEEMAAFWEGCRLHDNLRRRCALPLVLVTAQRPGEVLLVEPADLDLERGLWFLPGEKTKTGRENLVPLSPLAVRLFREALEAPLSPSHLFLAKPPRVDRRNPGFRMEDVDPVRQELADRLGRKPPRWTPHDLRRTAYSGMTALGIPRLPVVEAVVNHVIPGVAGVYDRYDYLAEKTDALNRWGQHLDDLFSGRPLDNVRPISRAARG